MLKKEKNNEIREEDMIMSYEYLEKARKGDKDARDLVVMRNIHLIKNVIKEKFNNEKHEEEDLFAFGVVGLIEAIDTYREDMNVSFAIHARRFIFNRIMNYITSNKNVEAEVSLDALKDNVPNDTLENTPIDYFFKDCLLKLYINEALEILEPKEKEMIEAYFGFVSFCLDEESEEKVRDIIGRCLEKIKKEYFASPKQKTREKTK